MEHSPLETKLKAYYLTAIFSLVFAVVGFSYNAWRMEVSEDNNTVRTAAFDVLKELAEFEQIIFAAHYDQNLIEGSPRKGWVKIGLIVDLSTLISAEVVHESEQLHAAWAQDWQTIHNSEQSVQGLVKSIEHTRQTIKTTLEKLQ